MYRVVHKSKPQATFRAALSLASIRLSRLSIPLLDCPLDGNSSNSFFVHYLFSSLRLSVKILLFTLILLISLSRKQNKKSERKNNHKPTYNVSFS